MAFDRKIGTTGRVFADTGPVPNLQIDNAVTATPAAAPTDALAHFEALLAFETDCWDVH